VFTKCKYVDKLIVNTGEKMSKKTIFARFIQMADMLGQMFANTLEVVIHDFNDLDHSIIHIVNGHISGRTIGDGASELGIRRMLSQEAIPDLLVNYANISPRGQKLKSASLAIRDDRGQMIGAFCLNFDLSQFERIHNFLTFFMQSETHELVGSQELTISGTNKEELCKEIENYLLRQGLYGQPLTYKDKQTVVEHLLRQGAFAKRGAISHIAEALQLTRQCIYNYLELAKNKSSN
jgi:predicted transcriptional regulator YheO